jgi:hypothetical protein
LRTDEGPAISSTPKAWGRLSSSAPKARRSAGAGAWLRWWDRSGPTVFGPGVRSCGADAGNSPG